MKRADQEANINQERIIDMYEVYEKVANRVDTLHKISTEKFDDKTDAVKEAIRICLNSDNRIKSIKIVEVSELEECIDLAAILNGVK